MKRLDFSFSKYSNLEYSRQNWNEYKKDVTLPQSKFEIDKYFEKNPPDQSRNFKNNEEEIDEDDLDTEYDEEEFQQSPFIHPVTPLPVDPESEKKHQCYGIMNNYRRMLIHTKPTSKATESTGFPEFSTLESSEERYLVNRTKNRLREIRNNKIIKSGARLEKKFKNRKIETNAKATMVLRGDPQIVYREKAINAILLEDVKNTQKHFSAINDYRTIMLALSTQLTEKLKIADASLNEMERQAKAEEAKRKKKFEEAKQKEEAKKKKAGGGGTKTKDGKTDGQQPQGQEQKQQQPKVKKNPYEGLKQEWLKTRVPLTRPPKNCSENAYVHYLICVRAMIASIGFYDKFDEKKDPTFKKIGRELKTTMNQVGTDLGDVRKKYSKIRKLLNACKKQHAALYYYGLVTIATNLVRKGSVEISRDKTKHFAFSFGYLALLLSFKFRQFRNIFLGKIYEACPWAIPWFPIKPSTMDEKEYRLKRLKYDEKRRNPNGLETEDLYFGRMEGIICLYSAYSVIPSTPHPHGMAWAWRFFTHLLNIKDLSRYTPTVIIGFLTIAGYAMHKKYKGQFIKILKLLQTEILPKMKEVPGTDSSAIGRIELYLEFVKKNKAPKAIQFCDKKFWESL